MICQAGYEPGPLTGSCILCPTGQFSTGSNSLCSFPKEPSVEPEDLYGLVVMFPTGSFVNPVNIAVDRSGVVYTSDPRNSMVHQQSGTGVQSSIIGNDFETFRNVRVDSNGDVFITDMETRRVRKITSTGIVLTMAGGSTLFD